MGNGIVIDRDGTDRQDFDEDQDLINFNQLSKITETSVYDLKRLHSQFSLHAVDGKLNKKQFHEVYTSLRYEDPDKFSGISEFIFKAFDKDKNGEVGFQEFVVNPWNNLNNFIR